MNLVLFNMFWFLLTLHPDRDTALEKVKEIAALKEEWETKLYGRFVAILNAKKERIQMLEEDMGLNTEDHEKNHKDKSGG